MLRFEPSTYYTYAAEPASSEYAAASADENMVVKFHFSAKQLVADYYKDKYDTVITISDDVDYCDHLPIVIAELRKKTASSADYREAYSFGQAHSITVVYFKENGHEAILYSDSLATTYKAAANKLHTATGLPVYAVTTGRQADYESCHVDSMVQCRIATAKNKVTGQYVVPDFLTKMISRSAEKKEEKDVEPSVVESLDPDEPHVPLPCKDSVEKKRVDALSAKTKLPDELFIDARLPDECLITCQRPMFRLLHKEKVERVIHIKNEEKETLNQQLTRYNILLKTGKILLGYNRKKSHKLANIIEIQFYVNQLKQLLGAAHWTIEIRKQFIQQAKTKLNEQPFKPSTTRVGLFDFANAFLFRIRPAFRVTPFFRQRTENRNRKHVAPIHSPAM